MQLTSSFKVLGTPREFLFVTQVLLDVKTLPAIWQPLFTQTDRRADGPRNQLQELPNAFRQKIFLRRIGSRLTYYDIDLTRNTNIISSNVPLLLLLLLLLLLFTAKCVVLDHKNEGHGSLKHLNCLILKNSSDTCSSVRVVIRLCTIWTGVRIRRTFFFSRTSRPCLGPTRLPFQCVLVDHSAGRGAASYYCCVGCTCE